MISINTKYSASLWELKEYLYSQYCPVNMPSNLSDGGIVEIVTSITGSILINMYLKSEYGDNRVFAYYYGIKGNITAFILLLPEKYDKWEYDDMRKRILEAKKEDDVMWSFRLFGSRQEGCLIMYAKSDDSMKLLEHLWKFTDICPYKLEDCNVPVTLWYKNNYPIHYQKALELAEG